MPYSCPQLHPRTSEEGTKVEVVSREVAFGTFQSRVELTSQSCLARSLKPMGRAHKWDEIKCPLSLTQGLEQGCWYPKPRALCV